MIVKQMHMMRVEAESIKKSKKRTPLAKEIERYREEIIRDILGNSKKIIQQQLNVASLTVGRDEKNNDTVMKATNSLLDRAFGKAKESIDFTGNVQFSLKELAKKRLEVENEDVTPLEDMI